MTHRTLKLLSLVLLTISAQGCVAAKVASTAVSTGVGTVKTTAKVGKGAVDLVTPDGDREDHRDDNNDDTAPQKDKND